MIHPDREEALAALPGEVRRHVEEGDLEQAQWHLRYLGLRRSVALLVSSLLIGWGLGRMVESPEWLGGGVAVLALAALIGLGARDAVRYDRATRALRPTPEEAAAWRPLRRRWLGELAELKVLAVLVLYLPVALVERQLNGTTSTWLFLTFLAMAGLVGVADAVRLRRQSRADGEP